MSAPVAALVIIEVVFVAITDTKKTKEKSLHWFSSRGTQEKVALPGAKSDHFTTEIA
jgi:hypothetical protein